MRQNRALIESLRTPFSFAQIQISPATPPKCAPRREFSAAKCEFRSKGEKSGGAHAEDSPHDAFGVVGTLAQHMPRTAAVGADQLVPVGVHAEGGGAVFVGFPSGAVVEVVGVLVVVLVVVALLSEDVVTQVQRNEVARFHQAVEIQVVQSFAGVVPDAAPQHLGGPLLLRLVPTDGRIHSPTRRPSDRCLRTLATALVAALLVRSSLLAQGRSGRALSFRSWCSLAARSKCERWLARCSHTELLLKKQHATNGDYSARTGWRGFREMPPPQGASNSIRTLAVPVAAHARRCSAFYSLTGM